MPEGALPDTSAAGILKNGYSQFVSKAQVNRFS